MRSMSGSTSEDSSTSSSSSEQEQQKPPFSLFSAAQSQALIPQNLACRRSARKRAMAEGVGSVDAVTELGAGAILQERGKRDSEKDETGGSEAKKQKDESAAGSSGADEQV